MIRRASPDQFFSTLAHTLDDWPHFPPTLAHSIGREWAQKERLKVCAAVVVGSMGLEAIWPHEMSFPRWGPGSDAEENGAGRLKVDLRKACSFRALSRRSDRSIGKMIRTRPVGGTSLRAFYALPQLRQLCV